MRQKWRLQRRKRRKGWRWRGSKERQTNDQDARTPATVTTPTVDIASSSRTPAAVGHERRVVRALVHLRSPYIDPENTDPFFCSKEVCDIYDAVCQYSAPTTRTRAKQTTDNRQEKSTPLLCFSLFFSCLQHRPFSTCFSSFNNELT